MLFMTRMRRPRLLNLIFQKLLIKHLLTARQRSLNLIFQII